jgi:hypothetical protein
MKRLFFQALICATYLLAAGVNADDSALEQHLNDVYTQLRRTLMPLEKEALKQEELHWLNERDRFPRGDPRRTELTEERIRAERTASSFQSANTTGAPDSAKAFAVARPSPDPAPVTSATLFSYDMFITKTFSRTFSPFHLFADNAQAFDRTVIRLLPVTYAEMQTTITARNARC